MQRIVWGRATSSNVMKVLWGLGEMALPFERIDVGGAFGKTETPGLPGHEPDRPGADTSGRRFHLVGKQRDPALSANGHAPARRCSHPSRTPAPMSIAGWTRSRRC